MGKGRDKRKKKQKEKHTTNGSGETYRASPPEFIGQLVIDPGKLYPIEKKERAT